MIRISFIIVSIVLSGCLPFRPAQENEQVVQLGLGSTVSVERVDYPAPITTMTAPAYLDRSTVWYSDSDGRLMPVKDYLWAEPLPDAIRRNLVLILAREKSYPAGMRIDLNLDRFLLSSDGSSGAVIEGVISVDGTPSTLPIVRVSVPDVWDPSEEETFLVGYRKLLEQTGNALKTAVDALVTDG